MKILALEVEGYRSFRSQQWRPGDLNLLIGPNAGGKSNLLRVFELLNAAANGGLGRYIQREGGMEPVVWDGTADYVRIRIKTTPFPPYSGDEHVLTYELKLARLGASSSYRIEYEILGNFYRFEQGQMDQPFKLLERDPNHAVVFSTSEKRFEAPPASVPEQETLLSLAAGPFSVNEFVARFQRALASWKVHQDFQTHRDAAVRMPQVSRTDTQVNADGQNLISVLHSLYNESREFKKELHNAMQAAFGDAFEELLFPPAADQRIQLRIRWQGLAKHATSAADLSDGTLRFLYLLAVLGNPNPPPLIAIDEPETGLHPSMLPIVAEYAQEAAGRTQVVLTTHSPEFLDAFGDEPPTTTVVECADGESTLRVLSGSDLSYWLKKYTLGALYRSNELEAMK